MCSCLLRAYVLNEFRKFHVGQAQKWIDMALKYVFLFPELAHQYGWLYNYCHVQLDNIILACLSAEGLKSLLEVI